MPLSFQDIKNRAHKFVQDYSHAVKENAESQSFLNAFFEIFGVNRLRVASFELPVKTDDKGTKRIDLFWPACFKPMRLTKNTLSHHLIPEQTFHYGGGSLRLV